MTKTIKSFVIHNIIYDNDKKELTLECDMNGRDYQVCCMGADNIDDILRTVKEVINEYYTVES
jgi:hypothetical protein